MHIERKLLLIGSFVPIVYFSLLFIAGALYPDYSHIRQVPSDLGADGAPYQWAAAFNIGLYLVGILGVLGGGGVFMGLRKLGMGKLFALLTSLTIIMPSINMMMSGIFPLPSPYHSLLELLFPSFFAPLFGALIMQSFSNLSISAIILFGAFLLNIGIFTGILGFGGFVTMDNLGLWIRLWAFIIMPTMGYICWMVRSKLLNSLAR